MNDTYDLDAVPPVNNAVENSVAIASYWPAINVWFVRPRGRARMPGTHLDGMLNSDRQVARTDRAAGSNELQNFVDVP